MPLTPEQQQELSELREFLRACMGNDRWQSYEAVQQANIRDRISEMIGAHEHSEYKRGIIRGLVLAFDLPHDLTNEANGTEQDT